MSKGKRKRTLEQLRAAKIAQRQKRQSKSGVEYRSMDRKAEDTSEFRLNMLHQNLDRVMEYYDKAVAENVETPVVFLIDMTDRLGAAFARGTIGEKRTENVVTFIEGIEQIPTLTAVCSHQKAVELIRKLNCSPKMLPTFSQPCAGNEFWVVVVAKNANLFTKMAKE